MHQGPANTREKSSTRMPVRGSWEEALENAAVVVAGWRLRKAHHRNPRADCAASEPRLEQQCTDMGV